MTRIAIIGPGAVGVTVAAWLARAAAGEVIVCAREAFPRIEAETPYGPISASPPVLTDPAGAGPADWVLVATKAYDAEGAARWFPALRQAHSRVAILQNGVEHVARFSPFLPAECILPVMVDCPAERNAPGRVRQCGAATMVVPDGEAGRAFVALFEGTRIDVRTTPDWTTAAWRKLALNAAGAVSAVTLQPGGVAHLEAVAEVMRGLVREVVAVGRAEGARLDDRLVEEIIAHSRQVPRDAINSLLADRLAGRPMESEARNGVVVRLGRRHGLPTPYNETLFACLCAVERGPGGFSFNE